MLKIHLPEQDKIIECSPGGNLYEILSGEGLMDAPCGGGGLCGKCICKVENSVAEKIPFHESTSEFFTAEEIVAGWRLACLFEVESDIYVNLPLPSRLVNIICSGYMKDFAHDVAAVPGEKTAAQHYGAAIDIGTTTVVASLIDLERGIEIESVACLNGQKAFGQDVMTRIQYASSRAHGTEILKKTIVKDINRLISELCKKHQIGTDDIHDISVAANTTMIHFLAGINPQSLGKWPYKPAFEGALTFKCQALGLNAAYDSDVYCLPIVSAFIGGDITAGVLACDLENSTKNTLFIDIGTNGEIVLAGDGLYYACSCAAGPALEGMNISCGVRAAQGAIDDVSIDGEDVRYTTICGADAEGICGSGLLAGIAEMRREGIINKRGRLQDHSTVEMIEGKKRFVIDKKRNIYITQHDIRQVQLAKGAILSGIYTLIMARGINTGEVQRVLVAGQFGAHLKAESLVGSGLLPPEWRGIISYVGNTSQSGAQICLLSQSQRKLVEKLANDIQYIELSQAAAYADLYIKCMQF
ncbi:MAG: ASKHA domain-containing protein [Syntrophomonas sp.]